MCFYLGYAQTDFEENFDSYTDIVELDWETNGFFINSSSSCIGASVRDNLTSNSNKGELISPNIDGLTDGTDLTLSFDYKVVNWPIGSTATAPGWGNFIVQYSIDDGNNWVDIMTVNDSNHTTSTTCENKNYTISGSLLPQGVGFKIRFDITWNAGDYYVYIDNVIASRSALSINENAFNSFKLYPNPTKSILNFETNETIDAIIIYNILGERISTNNIDFENKKIDVSQLNSGAYFMKVSIKGKTATYKFIKI